MIKIDEKTRTLSIEARPSKFFEEANDAIRALVLAAMADLDNAARRDFWKRFRAELKAQKKG